MRSKVSQYDDTQLSQGLRNILSGRPPTGGAANAIIAGSERDVVSRIEKCDVAYKEHSDVGTTGLALDERDRTKVFGTVVSLALA
jgi:hypothetical protein